MRARIVLAIALANGTAFAQPPRKARPPHASGAVTVTVVEVAGASAYLQPGANGGVRRGSKVVLQKHEYVVTEATSSYAVIDVTRAPVHEQDRGTATAAPDDEEKAQPLAKPRPLATWERAWMPAAPPANEQTPRPVPLGVAARERRFDVRLSMSSGALLPLGHGPSTVTTSVDARVHAEPFAAPLAIDVDASVQRWFGTGMAARDGRDTRPLLWVREALVGYGQSGWYAGLGRMRYAASTLGTLDGARVRAPLGEGFSIGAFGGLLPNPLGGQPSLDAQRFGIEAAYSRPDVALRPEGALVVHGSTFGGSLDERRISGTFEIFPGLSRLGGYFEVSSFDANNPWKAKPVELTAGGLDGSIRIGAFELGARVDVRQPERSRWLASYLPTWWFCRTTPIATATSSAAEPCDGAVSTRALGAVDASVDVGQLTLTLGGTAIRDLTQTGGAPDSSGVFASGRVVRIAKIFRVDASASWSRATYLDMYGGSVGPGVSLLDDRLELSSYYRNATLSYRTLATNLVQHGGGGSLVYMPSSSLMFSAHGEAILGGDANAVLLFGTATWRPRL